MAAVPWPSVDDPGYFIQNFAGFPGKMRLGRKTFSSRSDRQERKKCPTPIAAAGPGMWRRAPISRPDRRFSRSRDHGRCMSRCRGCRLAVDLYLPEPEGEVELPRSFPTICIFTPYYRRFKVNAAA